MRACTSSVRACACTWVVGSAISGIKLPIVWLLVVVAVVAVENSCSAWGGILASVSLEAGKCVASVAAKRIAKAIEAAKEELMWRQ